MLLMKEMLNEEINIPSKRKEIDPRCSIDYLQTSIKEGINLLSFMNIMEYTADKIYNEITL